MHTKEKIKCTIGLTEPLATLLQCYTTRENIGRLKEKTITCTARKTTQPYSYIFVMTIEAARIKQIPQLLASLETNNVVTIGIQVAINPAGNKLIPALGLLSILRKAEIKPIKHYARVSDKAATLYTYGRDILPSSIIELNINEKCKDKPVIVLTREWEPIGYGHIQPTDQGVLIRNSLDIGWYLRSGV